MGVGLETERMAWPAAGSGIVVVTDGAVLGTVVVTDGVVLAGSVLVSNVWPQAPSASRRRKFRRIGGDTSIELPGAHDSVLAGKSRKFEEYR